MKVHTTHASVCVGSLDTSLFCLQLVTNHSYFATITFYLNNTELLDLATQRLSDSHQRHILSVQ